MLEYFLRKSRGLLRKSDFFVDHGLVSEYRYKRNNENYRAQQSLKPISCNKTGARRKSPGWTLT
jgi:hypothetical protein